MEVQADTSRSEAVLHSVRLAAAIIVAFFLPFAPAGCHNAELWGEMPADVASFITRYFPSGQLQSYTHNAGVYHVRIDDGPGLSFDSAYRWTDIEGYGMPLPQVLLFDQLPPAVYEYLQGTEQLNAVFGLRRDRVRYTVTLLDNDLYYDIASGKLSGSTPAG